MNVRDAMTTEVLTVAPSATVADALTLMRQRRFRHLPVVQDGRLVGIVSERDLHVPDSIRETEHFLDKPIRSVMTTSVVTVSADDPIDEAARLMLENKVSSVPVCAGDTVTGILTQTDVYRALLRILGVTSAGTRIQVRARDLAEALAHVAAVSKERSARILNVVSELDEDGTYTLSISFKTMMLGPLVDALRAAGLEVSQPLTSTPASLPPWPL